MSYKTENLLAFAPGLVFGCLDGGGMVTDRDSGEYVPIEQVLHDPLHIDKLDIIDQDNFGHMKLGAFEDESEYAVEDDDVDEDDDE